MTTVPTDLNRCTGHYVFDGDAANYAGGVLIDHSDRGHDFPLITGSPVWTTRDSVACADFDNSYYFERRQIIPLMGSVVMKVHYDTTGPDGNLDILATRISFFAAGDHAALTVTGNWADYDRRAIAITSAVQFQIGDRISSGAGITQSLSANTWHVIAGVWNLTTKQVKLKVGAAAATVDDATATAPQWIDDIIRLGYLKASGGLTAGKHLSIAEIAFFHDDILLNQPTLTDTLMASWA